MSGNNPVMMVHRAIKRGNLPEVVRLLTEDRSLLHMWTPFGTWLHDAASEGQLEIVEWLVNQGVDINAYNGSHETPPIGEAASEGHFDVVEFLIQLGAVLDTSASVRNPLFATIVGDISEEQTAVAKLLIDSGLDTSATYNIGSLKNVNARAFAQEWGRTEIVKLLDEKRS